MYNYRLLISYTMYQLILMTSRWVYMGYELYTLIHDHEKYNESIWIVSSLSVPIQTYIFYNVFTFYRSLPRIIGY